MNCCLVYWRRMLVVDRIDLPVSMHPIKTQAKDCSVADLYVEMIQCKAPLISPPTPGRAPRSCDVDDPTASHCAANGKGAAVLNLHLGQHGRTQGSDDEGSRTLIYSCLFRDAALQTCVVRS